MTAHELAKHLLEQPDYPVFINGWGSDEGQTVEVIGSEVKQDMILLDHVEVNWG